MQNRLMTIMFVDMQGYTKKSAQQTIEEMKLFHDQMFKFVTEIIDKHSGRMVKSLGDGFLVCFESPTNAVQSGIEIQRKLESRNAQMMNPDSIVRFRIGINTGEVGLDENGDLFGDPVNIASRIQTFADTNDVFISESTFLAMNRNEFGAVDLGAQELKNATREIRIYKVLKNGSPGMVANQKAPSELPTASKKKYYIAVAVIVGIFLLTLTVRGIRKKQAQNQLEQQNQTEQATGQTSEKPDSNQEPANSANGEDKKTILDIPADDPRLKFSDDERNAYRELQNKRQNKDFAEAEKIAAAMINMQPGPKKLPWGLIMAELFFEQGKLAEAEKISSNILKKAMLPPAARNKLIDQIERIRSKYRK